MSEQVVPSAVLSALVLDF